MIARIHERPRSVAGAVAGIAIWTAACTAFGILLLNCDPFETQSEGAIEAEGTSSEDEEVTHLTGLAFMEGHIRAGLALYVQGDIATAKTHMDHPIEGKYEAVEDQLESSGHGVLEGQIGLGRPIPGVHHAQQDRPRLAVQPVEGPGRKQPLADPVVAERRARGAVTFLEAEPRDRQSDPEALARIDQLQNRAE
ncbi:hypothetical protein [Sediminimonas qiaohouensis]|uniref:hypothetical protein n=1 Tax=Sediminimonas qiaohouensis TaxID=552061 RepID=UPI00235651E9|nr:hypothetical protein [Sediminimonas qiaohouensis]